MGLDSNAIQVRSEEFHTHTHTQNLKKHEVDITVKLIFEGEKIISKRKKHSGKLCSI